MTLREAVRRIVAEALAEAVQVTPEYAADLDAVSNGLQTVLKSVEAAHQKAPDPVSKTILAGIHSDLFNAAASSRGYLKKLKSGNPQG